MRNCGNFFRSAEEPVLTRDDPTAFAPPPAFGPFRVLHQIGAGVLGPVFRTYEPTRDRLVAVKVFRLDITPEQAQALADELAKAADAGLFHPSIVEPVAAGIEGTVAYRAEEYVAAESLDVAMRHYAPAELNKALPLLTQLAGAIDFARAAGIGHGALHPRDIFVTPDEARLTGFGVVDALERVGLRAPVRRPYSPPERVAGESWTTAADVFSLGVVAFELMTGRRPSGPGDQIGAFAGPNLGPHAEALMGVLARAMDEHPERRYQSALAFAAALEAAARGESVSGAVTEIGAVAGAAGAGSGPALIEQEAVERRPPAGDRGANAADAAPAEAASDFNAESPDDVSVERDEDEAYSALVHEEEQEEEDVDGFVAEADGDREFDDAAVEAAADRLVFDAADLALTSDEESVPASLEFEEAEADVAAAEPAANRVTTAVAARSASTHPSAGRSIEPSSSRLANEYSYVAPESERSRLAVLPLAITLLVGLLIGFAAGYGLAPRVDSSGSAAAVAQTTAAPATAVDSASQAASQDAQVPPSQRTAGTAGARGTSPAGGESAGIPTAAPRAAAASPAAPPRPASPSSGRLVVRSSPSGANVTINGKWRGRTPLTIPEAAFGDYAVRVVLSGYQVKQETVTLDAENALRSVSYRLERQAPAAPRRAAPAPAPSTASPRAYVGAVYVDSRPRGARVLIDGKFVGTTPLSVPEVPIGSHVVRLELAAHLAWTRSVRVAAGDTARVTGSLEPIR